MRRYYAENREKLKADGKAYYHRTKNEPERKEKKRIRAKKYRAENREQINKQRLAWRHRRYETAEGRAAIVAERERLMAKRTPALKLLIAEAKDHGCSVCGETEHITLDFHHVDPSQKSFRVSMGLSRGISTQRLEVEIAKCVVLCANCHRKFHAGLVTLPTQC